MKESKKRTLYECSHARVNGDRIRCRKGYSLLMRTDGGSKGYSLLMRTDGGSIDIRRLARGQRLAFSICQKCPDFDCIGPPVLPEERGWLNGKGGHIK